jgi:hypothetical protein
MEIDAMSGEELEQLVKDIVDSPQSLLDQVAIAIKP